MGGSGKKEDHGMVYSQLASVMPLFLIKFKGGQRTKVHFNPTALSLDTVIPVLEMKKLSLGEVRKLGPDDMAS